MGLPDLSFCPVTAADGLDPDPCPGAAASAPSLSSLSLHGAVLELGHGRPLHGRLLWRSPKSSGCGRRQSMS
eukprot:1297459-Pyramimonas_sp.AAC.1